MANTPALKITINNKTILFWIRNVCFNGIESGVRYALMVNPNSDKTTVDLKSENEFYFLTSNQTLSDNEWHSIHLTLNQKNNLCGVVDVTKHNDSVLEMDYTFKNEVLSIFHETTESTGYLKLSSNIVH